MCDKHTFRSGSQCLRKQTLVPCCLLKVAGAMRQQPFRLRMSNLSAYCVQQAFRFGGRPGDRNPAQDHAPRETGHEHRPRCVGRCGFRQYRSDTDGNLKAGSPQRVRFQPKGWHIRAHADVKDREAKRCPKASLSCTALPPSRGVTTSLDPPLWWLGVQPNRE